MTLTENRNTSTYNWHRSASQSAHSVQANPAGNRSPLHLAPKIINSLHSLKNKWRIKALIEDPSLFMEIRDLILRKKFPLDSRSHFSVEDLSEALDQLWTNGKTCQIEMEAVLLAFGRPAIQASPSSFQYPNSEVLSSRLKQCETAIQRCIRATTLVQFSTEHNHTHSMGTAWFLTPNTLITSKGVANQIQKVQDGGFPFEYGGCESGAVKVFPGITSSNDSSHGFTVEEAIPIGSASDNGFGIITISGKHPKFESLHFQESVKEKSDLCVIGFSRLANDVDNHQESKLRISPGRCLRSFQNRFAHDCLVSDNSEGSAILDLNSGCIVGIQGSQLESVGSLAVRASTLTKTLSDMGLID